MNENILSIIFFICVGISIVCLLLSRRCNRGRDHKPTVTPTYTTTPISTESTWTYNDKESLYGMIDSSITNILKDYDITDNSINATEKSDRINIIISKIIKIYSKETYDSVSTNIFNVMNGDSSTQAINLFVNTSYKLIMLINKLITEKYNDIFTWTNPLIIQNFTGKFGLSIECLKNKYTPVEFQSLYSLKTTFETYNIQIDSSTFNEFNNVVNSCKIIQTNTTTPEPTSTSANI